MTSDYDVVVVGAGNAALSAAHAAAELGVTVCVLEKAPRGERGGNSTLTGHFRFAYENVDQLLALMDPDVATEEVRQGLSERLPSRTKEELWDEVMSTTEGLSDPELLRVHIDRSYDTVVWLHSKGHNWIPSFDDATTANVVRLEGAGLGLQRRNFEYLEDLPNVTVCYDTSATELIVDDNGAVSGVLAVTPAGREQFNADAVVLACGGFEANPEMRARYLGPRWDHVHNRGVPYNTGDGLRMALDIGAMPYGGWNSCHASPNDWAMPTSMLPSMRKPGAEPTWVRYLYPFSILVNVRGQRFADEADNIRALTYAKMGGAILGQPGGKAFQIIDKKIRDRGLIPKAYESGTGATADTLEELAAKLEVDPAGLVATVREFNAAVPTDREADPNPFHVDGVGTEGLVPPKSNFALTISEPPFEGYTVRCGITFTYGGVRIDPENAQVQHVSGHPIPQLYAAGEMVGGLWYWNYPSGSGLMAGATFGRMAGMSAAKHAQSLKAGVA